MIEDMQIRNLAVHTQNSYVMQVSMFARHFSRSPEMPGPEEVRTYHLSDERKAAGNQFDSHRYFCASLPLQSHSQEELDF
jgi:hypothetical protein